MLVFFYSEDVFSSYACNSLNHKGIKHHPGDIVEAGCLAVSMYTKCFLKYLENQTGVFVVAKICP